jgi:glycogen(starch) synthase
MRLLIATDAFPPKCGGSGWSTYYLARSLRARGHWVEIIMPKPGAPGIHTRAYDNLPVTEFGFAATNLPGLRAWQRTSVLDSKFSAFLAERAGEADLIHAQHLLTIPAAVIAGRAAKVPVVSTVRDYWPVCLYGTLWRAEAHAAGEDGAICPICRGGELVLCLRQKYGAAAPLARPFLPLVERELGRRQRALRESAAVVAVSHFVAEKLHGIVDDEKMSVVPNLVDVEEIHRVVYTALAATNAGTSSPPLRGAPPGPSGPEQGDLQLGFCKSPLAIRDSPYAIPSSPYLLFIGKLNELKGANWLGEIVRRANVNLKLIVLGDGPLAGTLASVPNIDLRGWVSNEEALNLLAHAHALLFPSRWAEPLARVLLEAQALGTPAVALDTGGTRDIIEHEVNGLLAHDLDEFAAQLARLMNDESLRQSLRNSAQRIARERFGEKVIAQQMEEVYEKAVNSGQRREASPLGSSATRS